MDTHATFWKLQKSKNFPLTVGEAVSRLIDELPASTLGAIRVSKNPIEFHFYLGRAIRNNFGLWQGNFPLLESCKRKHPDDASGVILQRLHEVLNST